MADAMSGVLRKALADAEHTEDATAIYRARNRLRQYERYEADRSGVRAAAPAIISPVNTETGGGTRYSTGKPIMWCTPWRGLPPVCDAAARATSLPSTALSCMLECMDNPRASVLGISYVALAAFRLLDALASALQLFGWQESIIEVCRVSEAGAAKYAPFDWQSGQSYGTLLSSAMRHVIACESGGILSRADDSGQYHAAHAVWNLLCLMAEIRDLRHDLDDITPWRGIAAADAHELRARAASEGVPVLSLLRERRAS